VIAVAFALDMPSSVGARQSRGDNLLSPVCPHHGVADST